VQKNYADMARAAHVLSAQPSCLSVTAAEARTRRASRLLLAIGRHMR
jgi:hypothetical protein